MRWSSAPRSGLCARRGADIGATPMIHDADKSPRRHLMTTTLDGRTALVTAAGRAIAFGLGHMGARVGLLARTQHDLDQVAAEIRHDGGAAGSAHRRHRRRRPDADCSRSTGRRTRSGRAAGQQCGGGAAAGPFAGKNILSAALEVPSDMWLAPVVRRSEPSSLTVQQQRRGASRWMLSSAEYCSILSNGQASSVRPAWSVCSGVAQTAAWRCARAASDMGAAERGPAAAQAG
jgi:hypothetical protein